MSTKQWEFWVDCGGTFTDIVARTPDGKIATTKLLSENPEHYADAAVQGVHDLMGTDTPRRRNNYRCQNGNDRGDERFVGAQGRTCFVADHRRVS